MKRLIIILIIVAVTGMIFPGYTTFAQPNQTPHENPAMATGSLDKISLLLNYSKIISLASQRQYTDAQEVLNEIRKIDLPDDLRYITDRYNDLCQQLFTTLDSLETVLDETSKLIARNKIDAARRSLDTAEILITDAGYLLDDIKTAVDILSDHLGVFSSPISSEVREAHDRLEAALQELKRLIEMLDNLRQNLAEEYTERKRLLPTQLTLTINPNSAFVGDAVNASGTLSSYDEPLPGRNLTIMLDDNITAVVTTGEDGSYSTNITLPYKYTEAMGIISIYEPYATDIEKYQACQSPQLSINTMFYPTLLEVSAPSTIYPAIPFEVVGKITSSDGNIDRTVTVSLDNVPLTKTTASGEFSLEISPPEPASPGQQRLTVTVSPEGRYSGASVSRIITVALMPLTMDLQTPSFIFLPNSIHFQGSVRYETGPVADAGVNLAFNDASAAVRTAPDGSFTATLEAPLDLSFIGRRELTVNIYPEEPWASHLSVNRPILVINPVGVSLVLVAALALVILASRKRRAKDVSYIPLGEVTRSPVPITPRTPAVKLTGIKARIIASYRTGLIIIEKICGMRMAPQVTLREFLQMVTKAVPKITKPLTSLTMIAEKALYSNRRPPQETATTAEEFTADIKKELDRGTP
jgi:hypothetical protein